MAKSDKIPIDSSTEEKIKAAARIVFTRKGYAATRTRDIAEEAGLNLALLNYYFRTKEKLFEIIMLEKVQILFGVLGPLINDRNSTLEEKVARLTDSYFTLLSLNPDLPLFVLSEIKNNPSLFSERLQLRKLLKESHFIQQIQERRPDLDPFQVVLALLGMVIFPFIARPILYSGDPGQQDAFATLIHDRKKLVPVWFASCLNTS